METDKMVYSQPLSKIINLIHLFVWEFIIQEDTSLIVVNISTEQ